jgi:hypothetical protein
MSAKSLVICLSKNGEEEFNDIVGLIHIDENIVVIRAGNEISISFPVGDLMDFIKSEVMRE